MPKYTETTGYIIHCRDFNNSSIIVEFFSKELGKIQLLAKGIKNNKKRKIQLHYFCLIKIQFFGKSQLKTLVSIEIIENHHFEDIIEKTAGLYLNELIRFGMVENEQALTLFNCYSKSLNDLGNKKLSAILREFEYELLKFNGFELNVDSFENTDEWLTFSEDVGLQTTTKHTKKLCQVIDLKSFLLKEVLGKTSQKRINKLMFKAINVCLLNRKIYSRDLLKSLF